MILQTTVIVFLVIGGILGYFGFFRHFVSPNTIVGSGKLVSQVRPTPAFRAVQLDGIGNVIITQDASEKVRVEADDNIVDSITTEVHDGTLRIGLKEASCDRVTGNIHISARKLDAAVLEGDGGFEAAAPIDCRSLSLAINGAGSMRFSGTADELSIQLNGMGEVQCLRMVAQKCSVRISGMGECEVNASRELDALIAGTGQIAYEGEPAMIRKRVTGMGRITKK